MNLKKLLTTFLLATTILTKTIHYHYHLTSQSPKSHKTTTSHKATYYLKTSNGKIIKNDLSLYTIPKPDLSEFKLQKLRFYDKDAKVFGILFKNSKGEFLGRENKEIIWKAKYEGLNELWNMERTRGGNYIRGEGEDKKLYLSNAGNKLSMSFIKGTSALWKD